MAIRNDYLLDMIQSFAQAIVGVIDRGSHGVAERDALGTYNEVVGRVLDMPADAVLALSPQSLVTMMQISAVDESLAVYMVFSLERIADVLEGENGPLAAVRRSQAQAVADAYGFPTTEVPSEVQDGLDSQDPSGDAR